MANEDGFDFSPARRLRVAREFGAVFSWRRVLRGSQFDLHFRPGEGREARLGLVIAKKLARHAVVRNAIKRIARDVFRHQRSTLPPMDIVLRLAKPAACAGVVARKAWRGDIEKLLNRLPVPLAEKIAP